MISFLTFNFNPKKIVRKQNITQAKPILSKKIESDLWNCL